MRPPPSADRLKLANPNLLQPLEKLLLMINSDTIDNYQRHEFIKTALPYCHAPKSSEPPVNFNFGHLKTAAEMLAAQGRVMKSMSEGFTPVQTGRAMIEALAIMIRSLDVTTLEDRLEQAEERARLNKAQPVSLRIIEEDKDESPPFDEAG
jgi:hypothetical protein